MTEVRTPAEVFPPSEFLRDEMQARGMTGEEDLEQFLFSAGCTPVEVFACLLVLHDDKDLVLDAHTAGSLSKAFGTSPEYWMNLDRAWRGKQ